MSYKYVFYWVKSQYEQIKGLGRGARADLNADVIGSYPIPIPPLEVQQKSSPSSTVSMRSRVTSRRDFPPRSPHARSSMNTTATSSLRFGARRHRLVQWIRLRGHSAKRFVLVSSEVRIKRKRSTRISACTSLGVGQLFGSKK
ncbi:MAG: restriction endonuclease subunit S [Selenomonas massiliensis]